MKDLRKDFPIFKRKIDNKNLIFLDNASTSQKPQYVLDTLINFYTEHNANVRRGIYTLSEEASALYEQAREKVARFINANTEEIIFTSGATEGINFIATSWGQENINEGDEIIISLMEHHSNFVPWQELAKRKKAILKIIKVTPNGELDYEDYKHLLSNRTKLVSISQVSNAIGTHNDIEKIIKEAKKYNAKVLVDAAQSVPHQKVDVKQMDCDFLVFSGHKMFAPNGIGVLFIKASVQSEVSPYQFGGGMVFNVDQQNSTWLPAPNKYEAGTPPIAQAIALGSAIDYINKNINFEELKKLESRLCEITINELSKIPNVRILGPIGQLKKMGHLVSFVIPGIHPHDIAAYLNTFGICVRAGNHCTQPLHKFWGIESSVRISFYVYNNEDEVKSLIKALKNLVESFY